LELAALTFFLKDRGTPSGMPDPVTTSKKTYFGIQSLRALAALMVVVHHAFVLWRERGPSPQGPMIWENGAAGVDIFFVISGFVMMISAPGLAGKANKAWVFFRRRLIRIVPLYWIFTTVKLILLWASPELTKRHVGSWWHVVASYLFISSVDGNGSIAPVVIVGWTLNYEMLLYVLFTVALLLDAPLLKFLAPTLVILAAVKLFYGASWPAFTRVASPLILEFLFGVLLAHFTLQGRLPGPRVSAMLFVAGAVAILITPQLALWRCLTWGIPAAAIVTAAVALEGRLGSKLPKWLLEAGNASYAIYLTHTFVLPAVGVALVKLHHRGVIVLVATILASLICSLLAGEVVHRIIEVPLMNFFAGRRVPGVTVLPA
jgi:exopolysaccharide production protein ExoZ